MSRPRKVLIVEDDAFFARWREMELKRDGHRVLELSSTGEAAVRSAREKKPDIVLMDLRLAGEMNGIEAAREILLFCSCFIVFITGYPDRNMETQARRLEPLGYLTKPIQIEALKEIINTAGEALSS